MQNVFIRDSDFKVYLNLLRKYKQRYRSKFYGYCLMKNHAHLLVEPLNSKNLAKLMQGINQSYSIYFNSRYRKNGHLWQGRYKSMVINKDRYLLTCLNYIELNPVRAGIVEKAEDYKWSSYRDRITSGRNRLLDELEIW